MGCVPELVSAGAGHLVPAGDREGLTRAMQSDLDQPQAIRAAGAVALRHAEAQFDVSVTTEGTVAMPSSARGSSVDSMRFSCRCCCIHPDFVTARASAARVQTEMPNVVGGGGVIRSGLWSRPFV
ncbi:MAG TPA: hypothetical protein DFR83_08500 [Deltaproteobacteria bacterium]|nr:hypothetical protein [Deltaproteobacteria bacterium]